MFQLINEEIGPNVNRLMKDRQKSLEYETAKRKYEIAFRKYVCYQYVACEEKAQSSGKVLEESKRKLHELNEKIQSKYQKSKKENQGLAIGKWGFKNFVVVEQFAEI